jgi:uncharacterized protein involved in response to NO
MRAIVDGPRPATLLAGVPHRLFFLAGVAALALDAAWWAWTICARAGAVPPPPVAVLPTALHAFVMLYGFAPFFMFGFLFTAGPRWLGVAPPPPSAWRGPGLVAAVAALSFVPLQALPRSRRSRGGPLCAGVGNAPRALRRLIRQSPAPDRVHATLVAGRTGAGLGGVVAFALVGAEAYAIVKLLGCGSSCCRCSSSCATG